MSDPIAKSEAVEILASVKRQEKSNRWTNIALWIVVVIALGSVSVAAATFQRTQNRDHDQLQLLTTANINLLKWAASDHEDKDSGPILRKIEQDLERYLDKDRYLDKEPHVQPDPSNPVR